MTPTLTTTPDGEIVYDPPHEHRRVVRNGQLAWCCSTRGTDKGTIGPVTRIPSGVGYLRAQAAMKRARALKSKSARESAETGIPSSVSRGAAAPLGINPRPGDKVRDGVGNDEKSLTASASNRADQTPSSPSMNGPSGKTASNAKSETTPNTPNDYPPTHATADLVASGAKIVSAREVLTVNGSTCVLTSEDGTDYWGSALLLSQLDKNPDLLPDFVVEATSKSGRVYRTFSKAHGKPARTFGRVGGG